MYMHMNSICTCIYIRLTNQSVLARGRAGTLPTHTPRIVLDMQYHLKMIINQTYLY